MIGQKLIMDQVLKLIDKTLGKKFKVIDKITDQFQGLDAVVDELKQENIEIRAEITQIKERIDENCNS
tara:strand:- start:225 stop:428 length:204 start_codon:yes stop_codon:yes gene_type:complete